MRILLDMDEVLCDYRTSASALFSKTFEELDTLFANEHGWWGGEEYDAVINKAGLEFWENLEPFPWTFELIDLIHTLRPENWYIATNPGKHPHGGYGKRLWLRKHIPDHEHRIVPVKYKFLMAKPGVVLIDDHELNIQEFIAEGGSGILFPSRKNVLKSKFADPIAHIKPILENLCKSQSKT